MLIMCRKGDTELKAVLYSLFPKAKSGALLSGHCREAHVGSAVLLCGAATDQLWESVLLQQPEWHWGAPKADLEENWGSKEHTFFLHIWTFEYKPLLVPPVPWSYGNSASSPQNEYVLSIKFIMSCVRAIIICTQAEVKEEVCECRHSGKAQPVFPTAAEGLALGE